MDLIYRFDPYEPIHARKIDGPDDAARTLREGNEQFVAIIERIRSEFHGSDDPAPLILPLDPTSLGISMVEGASVTQAPFALVLGCSDARVPIEMIFSQSSNDLFVVRVAGNVLGVECLGSIDYAVRTMAGSLKLVVVLGHSGCGAVTAAVDMYLDPNDYPDLALTHALRSLIDRVMIAVRGAAKAIERAGGPTVAHAPGYRAALIEISVFLNAALTAYDLRRELAALGDGHGIEVVYGVFDIVTQRVRSMPDGKSGVGTSFGPAPVEGRDLEQLAADVIRSVVERGVLYRTNA